MYICTYTYMQRFKDVFDLSGKDNTVTHSYIITLNKYKNKSIKYLDLERSNSVYIYLL